MSLESGNLMNSFPFSCMIKKDTKKAIKRKIVLNTGKADLFGMFMLEGKKGTRGRGEE